MADASYDVVLVGGGNKGIIAAMYLAKYGGLSVAVFEEKHELGGGWCSEESPAPGFVANHCSSWHTREYHTLVYEDFPEWGEYGAAQIDYPQNIGVIFDEDDTCCATYNENVDPTGERTAKLFARFSERDAEKWMWLQDKLKKYWRPYFREWAWNPAKPVNELDGMEKLINDPQSGVDRRWTVMTYPAVLSELFESKEVQVTFARILHSMGIPPDAYGGGFNLIGGLVVGNAAATYAGGTHAIVHASHRVIMENGGKVFTQSPVQKIIIENGRAKGIRLADGTEVEAKRAVLSCVDPHQLCLELIGEDYLSHEIIRKIKLIERDWTIITWYTWALRDRPRYKAESFLPDIWQNAWLHLGQKSLDNLLDEVHRRRMGLWPDPAKINIVVMHMTGIPGTCYAPDGFHSCLTEEWVVPAWMHDEKWWKEREKIHAEAVIARWQQLAPNMTWDNVIGYVPITPFFISRHARTWGPSGNWACIDNVPSQVGRWRPIPELAGHRMPIKNLYATGTAWHPLANAWSWQGYNVYKVMAEDLGLRKPWEERGRPY